MNNIYFFYGADAYRSFEKFKAWKRAFAEKYGAGTVREITKGENPIKLSELAGEDALFSKAQLIVVKNPFGDEGDFIDIEDFLNLASRGISHNTHLLLWQGDNLDKRLTSTKKILASGIKITEFVPLALKEAPVWIAAAAARLGLQIKKDAAQTLAKFTSQDGLLDSGRASSSLEQLAAFLGDKKVITLEDVAAVVAPSQGEDVFLPLLRAFGTRDRRQFLKLVHDFGKNAESDQELLGLVSALFEQVKLKLQVMDLAEKNYGPAQTDEILEFKKGRASFVLAEARKFKKVELENILNKILEIEYKVKQGQTVIVPAVQAFIQ